MEETPVSCPPELDLAQLRQEPVFIDVPVTPIINASMAVLPSGYEPMGMINLLGQSFQHIAHGQLHWWTLWSAWLLFGGRFLLVTIAAILMAEVSPITALSFWFSSALPLLIMGEGTERKLHHEQAATLEDNPS